MFDTGDKVVCVNDDFEPIIYELYAELPDKGQVYTVRQLDIGRANLIPGNTVDSYLVLLDEIHNPLDPLCRKEPKELGFASHRFVPLEEVTNEIHSEEHATKEAP